MRFDSPVIACISAAALLACCAALAPAQVTTADIVGTVKDASGGVLPGATVTIKNLGTGVERSMPTNEVGNYAFTLLPIGTYSVKIELSGFKTFVNPNVVLAGGDRARVDATMQIGELTETVEVQGGAIAALQTDTSTVGGLVTDRAVQDLPVNGRNFIKLAQLVPGAHEGSLSSLSGGGRPDDRRQTSTISVNGQADSLNNYLIDGMDNNERSIATIGVKPSIDALAEVKITANLYSADIGRTTGGVINMITKSGTNNFNGTLFEFLRNDLFDAKDFFNIPQAGNPFAGVKPKYRQNQFGGSMGGPIFKDKTFFFGDYEGLRIVQGKTGRAIVPTACQLGKAACNGIQQLGNFSDLPAGTVIYDVTQPTPTPFPNNIIPLDRINPISKKYAELLPALPKEACVGVNCTFYNSPIRTQTADTFDARIDHNFRQADSLFVRYSFNNTNTFTPGLLPPVQVGNMTVLPGGNSGGATGGDMFPGPAHQRQQHLGVSYVHTFNPTQILDLSAGILRYVSSSMPLNYGKDVNTAFGGPPVNKSIESSGLATVTFSTDGYGGIGDAMFLPTQYWDTTFQYRGNLTWTRGAHVIKFGGGVIRRRWSQYQSQYPKGMFAFHAYQTNSKAGGSGGTGGNSFASFLLGLNYSETQNQALIHPQYRNWEPSVYIQDDWRATSWLTLNLGIRYDIFTAFVEKHNKISSFDATDPGVRAGGKVLVAGQDGVSRTVNIKTQYNNLQPRLGFAAMLASKTVLRGGFGMTFFPNTVGSPSQMKNFPFVSNISNVTILGQPGNPNMLKFGNPLPIPSPSTCVAASCGAKGVIALPGSVSLKLKNGLAYQYNLMFEREFAGNIFTVGYVGSTTRNLGRNPNVHQPLPPLGPGGCGLTTVMNLPNPCQPYYSELPLIRSGSVFHTNGKSNYNSLQAIFQRRFSGGLAFSTNYTYARGLANAYGPEGGFSGQNAVPQWFEWYDYGNSAYDVRHRWSLTANYELPFGGSLAGFAGALAKGWQINVIGLYSTGLPFTVVNASNVQSNVGITTDRPNRLTARADFKPSLDEWFDTKAFALQDWRTAGNEGVNQFYAPAQKRMDLSIFKTFGITEEVKLQFRCEIFNFTNTPSFAPPGSTIYGWSSTDRATARPTQAGNFGKITTTSVFYTPRDIQFALKLLF
jgi:hypothetical protein